MSTMAHERAGANGNGVAAQTADWRASTRIVLQPIAAPSILGLYGFAAATFIVAAHLAGWYGDAHTPLYLAPFAAFFGGLAQFIAGVVSFRARDGLATAMHGMWGSFWMAFGLLELLVAVGALTVPGAGEAFPELGYWFLTLAAITAVGAIASLAENLGLFSVLVTLAVGSGLLAVSNLIGSTGWEKTGGWVLVASAILAFYAASAMMLAGTFGRVILPTGKLRKSANVPGRESPTVPIEFELGEPGVHKGQ